MILRQNRLKIISIFMIAFVITNIIVYYITELNKEQKIKPILENHIHHLKTHYEALLYLQKTTADLMYQSTIHTDGVIDILSQIKTSSTQEEKDILRGKLQEKVENKYMRMKKKGVLQYHFVASDNTTILRMHKPSRFDDDLSAFRYSFKYVNETKKIFRGFDQGKTSHAFRNIYPIFDKEGNYLCALDISFPSEVLQNYLTNIGDMHTHLLINKNIFDVKSWLRRDLALKYFPSAEHNDYMIAMTQVHSIKTCIDENRERLKEIKKQTDLKIKEGKKFSVYYKNSDKVKIVTFYPIKELENSSIVAWIVAYQDDYLISTALEFNLILRISLFFTFFILFYFIYHIINQKNILNLQVKNEVEKNRQKDQQMLEQSKHAQMGEMLSMIAHQWRQPLTAIGATSISLNIKARFNELIADEVIEKTEKISEYAQHLSTTIEDFRDFFKKNKEIKEVDYDELINSVLGIVEISIRNKDIKIVGELNCREKFETYPNEIKQVILNLLKNAEDILVEQKVEHPIIKISTYQENENFILEISDNGGGVPESVMKNIFNPYFSTKKEKNGTGLGLYMSKTIIEDHCGGKLTVSNNEEGAVFRINLGKCLKSNE